MLKMHMPKCVLIVDDDPRNLLALEVLLEPLGHRVVPAKNGKEAIRLFDGVAPDLVLCDLVMHGCDGLEVLGSIREHPHRSHTPVILVTAHTEREHRLRALQAGADEFLEKPIDQAILTARVNTLLRLKESRDELAARHQALQQMRREQRELTEFVVHDIKAPLTKLRDGVAQLAQQLEEGPETLDPKVAALDTEVRGLTCMLEDLLWISRFEYMSLPVRRKTITLNEAVRRVIERYDAIASEREIELGVTWTQLVTVAADERLLDRILDNLLDNALRHTPPGGRVSVALQTDDGVEMSVCNDGDPVDPLERERIFDKFVRGASEPPCPGHAGLGLYFCKRAVEALQGDIRVADVPGWSTSFRVWLPTPSSW
jgi:two-component system, sensor histidine kinase and response regulator